MQIELCRRVKGDRRKNGRKHQAILHDSRIFMLQNNIARPKKYEENSWKTRKNKRKFYDALMKL